MANLLLGHTDGAATAARGLGVLAADADAAQDVSNIEVTIVHAHPQ